MSLIYEILNRCVMNIFPHRISLSEKNGSFVTEDCENDRVLGNDPRLRDAEAARRLHGPQLDEGCEEAGEMEEGGKKEKKKEKTERRNRTTAV